MSTVWSLVIISWCRFHVDKMSSAHVYLRLHRGQGFDDISEGVLEDCAQLVKANSIQGKVWSPFREVNIYNNQLVLEYQFFFSISQFRFRRRAHVGFILIFYRMVWVVLCAREQGEQRWCCVHSLVQLEENRLHGCWSSWFPQFQDGKLSLHLFKNWNNDQAMMNLTDDGFHVRSGPSEWRSESMK